MKTILYQPLFINPQAYFVFPQLYHIEKGDSYIEPANITGQLIINDLTQSLTSTPILNVVQDTNQVDFGLFKGKHIRISQYTNIGAVALGEWYIPGTPTPPEPEQPDWFKESIVAWYSPYCKQRMTNFDVIEAYTEDFTKWAYRNYRGTAKITNNTIVITNVVETNNIVEDDNEPYSDLTIRVTGVTENKYLIVRQGRGKPEIHIKKDGVYTFKDNNLYFGFGVSVIGECNITIAQLPTSILKDFSGNGNHAYLYGGKGKLNSGMGVYEVDFTTYYGDVINSYTGRLTSNNKKNLGIAYNKLTKDIEPYTVKVTGIRKEVVRFTYRNEEGIEKDILIKNDGYYTVPKCYKDGTQGSSTTFVLFANYDNDTEVIIEQIPDYPDQLCYDDKMYAVAYNMPILTDYTVIAERTWFEKKGAFIVKGSSPNNGFVFERIDGSLERVQSLGAWNTITINTDSVVSYLTKNKYNNSNIKNGIGVDEDVLCIGGSYQKETNNINIPFIGCHGNILLFNRSLTEYEISWVKNNMMCSKPQEPDIDL